MMLTSGVRGGSLGMSHGSGDILIELAQLQASLVGIGNGVKLKSKRNREAREGVKSQRRSGNGSYKVRAYAFIAALRR